MDLSPVPVLAKGVVRADDAHHCVAAGAGGIIVSNHGARNLDTVVATAEALPAVARAVDGAVPVLVDGGIRRGTDIAKALILGADAVLVGRPTVWGLTVAGADGVQWVLETLWSELAMAMGLLGAASVDDLTPDLIWRAYDNAEPVYAPPTHTLRRGAGQRCQSGACVPSSIGIRTPIRRAVSMPISYPASACRTTPMPGSLVSTRSRRQAPSAVPSATTTTPAWIDLPIPTPPPWCTDTHDAPDAVFTSALRIGQSAIASDPSRMPSVSRSGEATLPASRWSRPITIGAVTAPLATRSLNASPAW